MKQQDKIALERYLRKISIARKSGEINVYETTVEQQERIARAKADIKYMVEYYFPHYGKAESADFHIYWAHKVKKDKKFTGFAKWARGHAKSVWNNIFVPFWLWLNGECSYFVIIGQNENRAKQLLEDIRVEFEANPRIIHDFGPQKKIGSWDEGFFTTKSGFIGQAVGLGQSCCCLRVQYTRPDLMNGDDLETRKTLKNPVIQAELVEWFEQELLPCMDGENERMMISNNWFAPKMFLKTLAEKHPDWFVHEVKAYNPTTYEPTWKSKYTAAYFREKEKKMGITSAHAEYLHVAKVIGKIFKEDLTQWAKLPAMNHFKVIVGFWDIAYAGNPTSDYNAVRLWGLYNNKFYYIDSFVRQSKIKPAVEWIAEVIRNSGKSYAIHWRAESQFWNGEVTGKIKEVEKEQGIQLPITIVHTPKMNKEQRIIAGLEATWQNGNMIYNAAKKNHNDTVIGLQQLYGIEPGYKTNDDAPDADQQAIEYLSKYIVYGNSSTKPKVGKVERKNMV
jgi:phage terminase large subunit-like protein